MIVVSKSWGRAWPAALVTLGLCGCLSSPQEKEARFLTSGKLHYAKKEYSRAILDFKNAVRFAPKDAEAYYQLGLAYAGINDLPSAYTCFKKATTLNPKHADAQLNAAWLALRSPQKELYEDAEKRVKRIVASGSANSEALAMLAFSELRLGKDEDATEYLQQTLTMFPADLSSSV
jgi:cytochrome c-type biogenesis protein CcmH/NrfG